MAARGDGPHLVVIDQFEEIFTLTDDQSARDAFLADTGPDVVIALGMRADFFAEAAREPVLLAALRDAQVVVGPLTAEQLRAVVVGPAKDKELGAAVADGLVEVVLATSERTTPAPCPALPRAARSLGLLERAAVDHRGLPQHRRPRRSGAATATSRPRR